MVRTALAIILLALSSYTPSPSAAEGLAPALTAQDTGPLLRKGQRIAIVGDSITEQKLYSKHLELYFLACLPELELKTIQFGWGGETAPGFLGRMANDLLPFKPDVVTTCYGMNDGGYRAFDEGTGKRYHDAMTAIVARAKAAGVVTVVVGSPGAVDTKTFKGGGEPPRIYNETLARLRDIARKVAAEAGMPFADLHDAMFAPMGPAKAALGEGYPVCGNDGFHPGANGQLLMASAFLKALRVDGNIGTITVDMAGVAAATDGHTLLGSGPGKAEIESRRWPFCFSSVDEKSAALARSILPFTGFNADFNRLTLVVKGLDAPKGKVSWGAASKSFPRETLEKGINLAAEFAEGNPFSEPFKRLDARVAQKQALETPMIKSILNQIPALSNGQGKDAALDAALEALRRQFMATHAELDRTARAAVVPVKHSIAVEPEK